MLETIFSCFASLDLLFGRCTRMTTTASLTWKQFWRPAMCKLVVRFSIFVLDSSRYDYVTNYFGEYNPARYRSILNANATFTKYYRDIVQLLFQSSLTLPSVYKTIATFVEPMYNLDLLQQFSYGHNVTNYKVAFADTINRMQQRLDNVLSQIGTK